MTVEQLIEADLSAKKFNRKHGATASTLPTAANELPCKYPQPTTDLTSHTPTSDWEALTHEGVPMWRLTQSGAKKVWDSYRGGGTTPIPTPPATAQAGWLWQRGYFGDAVLEEVAKGNTRTIQPGRARNFDRVDDYVRSDLSVAVSYPFTMMSTFRQTVSTQYQSVLCIAQNTTTTAYIDVNVNPNGSVQVRRNIGGQVNTDATSAGAVTFGSWAMVVLILHSDTSLEMFVDGVSHGIKSVVSKPMVVLDVIMVGALKSGVSIIQTFGGQQRDVRLYNRAVTPTEIADIYARTSVPNNNPELAMYPTNLLCHLHLEEGSGTNCPDSSGNGNDGTAFGITEPAFNYEGNDVPMSFQNELGYSGSAAPYTPANSTDVTKDPDGGALEFTGVVPKDARLIQSYAATFDGVDDFVTATLGMTPTYPFTMMSWVNKASNAKNGLITSLSGASATNYIYVLIRGDGTLQIDRRDDTNNDIGFTAVDITLEQFVHMSVVLVSSTAYKIYLDGIEVVNVTGALPVVLSPAGSFNELTIGHVANIAPGSLMLEGSLADARIYDREITAGELAGAFQGSPLNPIGSICHLPLAEGAGTQCFDISGNGNFGVAYNTTELTFRAAIDQITHANLKLGFTDNAGVSVPGLESQTADAEGNPIANPKGIWHNKAETQIDFTGGEPKAPWTRAAVPPQTYSHGDALPAKWFKQASGANEDQFYYEP